MPLMLDVMDKEPSLQVVWGTALLLGLIGLIATRFRRWLVLPALAGASGAGSGCHRRLAPGE